MKSIALYQLSGTALTNILVTSNQTLVDFFYTKNGYLIYKLLFLVQIRAWGLNRELLSLGINRC